MAYRNTIISLILTSFFLISKIQGSTLYFEESEIDPRGIKRTITNEDIKHSLRALYYVKKLIRAELKKSSVVDLVLIRRKLPSFDCERISGDILNDDCRLQWLNASPLYKGGFLVDPVTYKVFINIDDITDSQNKFFREYPYAIQKLNFKIDRDSIPIDILKSKPTEWDTPHFRAKVYHWLYDKQL